MNDDHHGRNKVPWYGELKSKKARYWSSFLPDESSLLSDEEYEECVRIVQDIQEGNKPEPEPLVEELQNVFDEKGGVFGRGFIYHPLVHKMMDANPTHRYYNNLLKQVKHQVAELLIKAQATQDPKAWFGIFLLIENPYRLDFFEVLAPVMSKEVYWESLADFWTQIENHWQNLDTIRNLWYETGHDPEGRIELMLDEDELQVWNNLPDETLTVYRGYSYPKSRRGWSWTLSLAKATWFANRFAWADGVEAKVVRGKVNRKDLLAFFNRGEEQEVVIDPKNVSNLRKVSLDGPSEDAEEVPEHASPGQ